MHVGGGLGDYVIDNFELSQIGDSFSSVEIGDANTNAQSILLSGANFGEPVTFHGIVQSPPNSATNQLSLTVSGVVAPGQSPGIIDISGDLLIDDDSMVEIELAGSGDAGAVDGFDQIMATGEVNIGANVTLDLVGLENPAPVDSLVIIERSGGSGTFVGLPEGHVLTDPFGNGQDFRLSYVGGDGDDVVLEARTTPTGITPTATSINENLDTSVADLLFASLVADDPDPSDTHTYELIAGDGDEDNVRFVVSGDQLFLKQNETIDYETQSEYTVRIRATDAAGLTFETSLTLEVNNVVELMQDEFEFDGSLVQRSRLGTLSVKFDSAVTIDPDAFTVEKLGPGGGSVPLTFTTRTEPDGSMYADLVFSGAYMEYGSLVDGNYQLTVDGSKITLSDGSHFDADGDGVAGGTMVWGDEVDEGFFRFYGDVNGDRVVSAIDFNAFATRFGSLVEDDLISAALDYNNDGSITAVDFNDFSKKFGKTLPLN
jgi:hypothetical protein